MPVLIAKEKTVKRKPVVALTMAASLRKRLFDRENMKALRGVARKILTHTGDAKADLPALKRLLKDADVAISSWEVRVSPRTCWRWPRNSSSSVTRRVR